MTLANYLRLIDLAELEARRQKRVASERQEFEDLHTDLAPYYRDTWTHDTDC